MLKTANENVDITMYREDFPSMVLEVNGKNLAYLDTAASAQKPRAVMDAMVDAMCEHYANIHRGLYHFSRVTTQLYEGARVKMGEFINAPSDRGIIFTRNTTEGINLVAQSWGRANMQAGDEIILTQMEHHANIVPWHLLAQQIGVVVKFIPVTPEGVLDLSKLDDLLSDKTKFVSFVHISNALGTINPAADIVKKVRAYNPDIKILIDGSQSAVHLPVDVQALDCDFFAFTGHKIYGPTGVGVLWGREELLNAMPPYQGGGDMIETVTMEGSTYKNAPTRFEAGTPAIVQAIGLGAAVDYMHAIGVEAIAAHEAALLTYAQDKIAVIGGIKTYGPAEGRAGILSFTADWAHASDIALILDKCGVAVRTGHHCCMPLMKALGVDATIRASLGMYSNKEDIDALIAGLKKAKDMLA
jgi:cysteine desulfurase/selenocysteine lyase